MDKNTKRWAATWRIPPGLEVLGHPPSPKLSALYHQGVRRGWGEERKRCECMIEEGIKEVNEESMLEMDTSDGSSGRYVRDFMALRNAIMDNCRDCIRDCGRDCLDNNAKPIENIRCPLQKVRIDYGMAMDGQVPHLRSWMQNAEDFIEL